MKKYKLQQRAAKSNQALRQPGPDIQWLDSLCYCEQDVLYVSGHR